jgi:Tfp pilus assembly protein PilN
LLPYLGAALLLVLSMGIGVFCLARLNDNKKENDLLASAVKERQDQITELKGKGAQVQQALSPDQKAMLTAAHKLVANKAFGWSRLFADLEAVLPSTVAASRISVNNIYQDGDRVKADLEFAVLAKDYQSVMGMIQNMNNSGLFQAELRGQDLQKNERITFTEYTFRLIYTPAYGYSARAATDVAQNQGGMQ